MRGTIGQVVFLARIVMTDGAPRPRNLLNHCTAGTSFALFTTSIFPDKCLGYGIGHRDALLFFSGPGFGSGTVILIIV